MEYIIDVLENTLSKEEAEKYYEKSMVEMDKTERIPYLEDEMKYISFFRELFNLNKQQLIVKINSFCSIDIEEFFEEEKEFFLEELNKIKIEDLILKNEIIIENFDDIIYFIKLSYRDFTAGYNKLELQYRNIGIRILSNSDYIYILETLNDLEPQVSVIAKENKIYLKKINDAAY